VKIWTNGLKQAKKTLIHYGFVENDFIVPDAITMLNPLAGVLGIDEEEAQYNDNNINLNINHNNKTVTVNEIIAENEIIAVNELVVEETVGFFDIHDYIDTHVPENNQHKHYIQSREGGLIHKSHAVNIVLNHANHYQSKDRVFRVRCNDLIRFENENIVYDDSEMIKVTDTLITYKKLSNKSIVAIIFTITKIKHLQKICDFIKYDELLECELTGTILKFWLLR